MRQERAKEAKELIQNRPGDAKKLFTRNSSQVTKQKNRLTQIHKHIHARCIIFQLSFSSVLPKQRFGSISFWRGSGSWDPHLGKVDPDPPFRNSGSGSGSSDPHLEKVDPDPGPKWIRIRVPDIKNIKFYFLLYIVFVCFGATRIQINAFLSGSGSGKRKR